MLLNDLGQKVTNYEEFYKAFTIESNAIENIIGCTEEQVSSVRKLVTIKDLTVEDVVEFVRLNAGAPLRLQSGMDVRIGNHIAPPGSPDIGVQLEELIKIGETGEVSAYAFHHAYLNLHPFMDGNGRSSRALWLRHMKRAGDGLWHYGFLRAYYYQTLDHLDNRA